MPLGKKEPADQILPYAARRRCRRRHAGLGKQWFSIESSVRITLAVPQLRVYCQPRASVAVLFEASVCTGAVLRKSRLRRPHCESPLRAASALWPANWVCSARQRSNTCGTAVERAIIAAGKFWSAPGSLGQLCNLAANPGETKNVSFDQPQIVKELIRIP